MTRLNALDPESANGKLKELFAAVKNKLGIVPNMMRTMGNSPALLDGYLSLSGALNKGSVGAKLGEQIALAVAEKNSCDYCASAHAYIAEKILGVQKKYHLCKFKW